MKTKKIRIRQGFTIVELVIVIGVIGVLSAVLIPTFINLNNKANEAADQSLIKNLNTQLAIKRESEGKNKTMYGALADALEAGYKVENLTPKGSKDIVWNQETDEFAQLEAVPAENAYKYWTVAKKAADLTKGYSAYLYYQPEGDLSVNVGIDVGEYSDINISYAKGAVAKKDVRFRTRGGSLKINADSDTVSHWAELDDLNIEAIADASYHEFGTIKQKAVVNQGHLVIEKEGSIPQVEVKSVPSGKTAKVTANASSVVTVDAASSDKASIVANVKDVFVDGVAPSAISGSAASQVIRSKEITTEAELKAAFDNGEFPKLAGDIALTTSNYSFTRTSFAGGQTENAVLAASKSVVLNLNGHKITSSADLDDEVNFIAVNDNGSLRVYDDSAAGNGYIEANAKMFYVRGELSIDNGAYFTNTLCTSTNFRSMIITDKNSKTTINGGKFYTPKCVMTSWGDVVINDGEFVCAGSTAWKTIKGAAYESWAYAIRLEAGNNLINGGEFYGIQGGLAFDGGNSTVKNVSAYAGGETISKFVAFAGDKIQLHPIGNKAAAFSVDSEFATAQKATFNNTSYYAVYICGEENIVYVTIDSGTFSTGKRNAAHIGNKSDGGKGLYAHSTINGGSFIAPSGQEAVYETGIDTAYGAGYTEIFGGTYSSDVTSLMKNTTDYTCRQQSEGVWVVSKN